jgi:type VI secretion system protein ImpA
MPSPETVDIEALLAPIPGDNPAGQDLRFTAVYDSIKEARRADDTAQRGEWQREIKSSNWPAVIQQATDALATKTKDLQIAVWLLEALVKRHGFAGLRDGLRTLRGLQERFWDSLYPVVEDGDLDFRAGPLVWVNDKFSPAIREVAVTNPPSGEQYSWWHYDESLMLEKLRVQNPERMAAEISDGKVTGEQFAKAATATPLDHYVQLFEDLRQSLEECSELTRVVDEKFGKDSPSFLEVKKAIEDCQDLVQDWVKRKGGRIGQEAQAGVDQPAAAANLSTGALPLEPVDRADALRRLGAVANFFRRTEPHSPVSYLVQRAVAWGEMTLEGWLREVIPNDDVLGHVRETLGLKAPNSSGTNEDAS